ncbi:MAG: radical SAM family heme chaperone HemW, partial [Candidatus Sericytochromatia bacterium]|nr:radical SAM family heme chaperone HemW [Candidatus Sericytochromatia bacterium]
SALYLHIPFCIKRCTYCDFTTHTDNTNSLIEEYVDQLCREINSYKKENLNISSIFFGGGTPSVLKIESLEKIFLAIHNNFKINDSAEITIEINPINLNRTNLKKYLNLGINRLSMGVQTFNQDLLKLINRNHSVEDIYRTYNAAREAGFKNFNLDLMFGLPQQTPEIWEDTIKKALELNPEHVSLYGLDLHDNTPLFAEVEAGVTTLPVEEETIKMFEYATEYLKSKDFIHYEISNWSREGLEAKHNISYWKNTNYLGVGVSAASYYNRVRYTNTKNITDYLALKDFANNKKPQTDKEDLEETVFMNLRLLKIGLDIKQINSRFNIDFRAYYKNELEFLKKAELIHLTENNLKLTEKAIFLSNEVFEKFIK